MLIGKLHAIAETASDGAWLCVDSDCCENDRSIGQKKFLHTT